MHGACAGTRHAPIVKKPRTHSTRRTSHFFSSACTLAAWNKPWSLVLRETTLVLLGRGKKSMRSTTPSSWIERVCKMHDEGKYCCLVVHPSSDGGEMLKWPPLSLSKSRQNTDGESKSGLLCWSANDFAVMGAR